MFLWPTTFTNVSIIILRYLRLQIKSEAHFGKIGRLLIFFLKKTLSEAILSCNRRRYSDLFLFFTHEVSSVESQAETTPRTGRVHDAVLRSRTRRAAEPPDDNHMLAKSHSSQRVAPLLLSRPAPEGFSALPSLHSSFFSPSLFLHLHQEAAARR